jgi:glycolate oxidase FAD binding subunit
MVREASDMTAPTQSLEAFGAVREATSDDAIDDVWPRVVVEPDTAEAVAQLLGWASSEKRTVVLRGGGTKMGWGRCPTDLDLIVSTRRLNRVTAHAYGDLTATVEAGTTLRALNDELARHGQWLPVDAAFDDATLGGVIATNEAGPLRHRFGTPRDLLIGVRLAMTDGHVVKAGGTVVKNVAGYDLGKLVSGSHGTLAAVVSTTFKLSPLPAASTTAVASFRDRDQMVRAVAAVSASQIEPIAFDVSVRSADPHQLLVRFATTQEAIDAQVDECRRLTASDSFELVSGAEEIALWRHQVQGIWSLPGVIARASWLPANLTRVLGVLDEVGRAGLSVDLVGRAGVGAGLVRLDGPREAIVRMLTRLRATVDLGHVVVLRAEPEVKAAIDVWGTLGDRAAILGAVKRACDPAGILNAGRGPV